MQLSFRRTSGSCTVCSGGGLDMSEAVAASVLSDVWGALSFVRNVGGSWEELIVGVVI